MNIYFACSMTEGREFESVDRWIVSVLARDGREVPTPHPVGQGDIVNIVTYDRLHSTMAEIECVGYDEPGDGTKTPPNAPHCLLLWRKPPPIPYVVGGGIF